MIIRLCKIGDKHGFSSYHDLSNVFLQNDRYVTSTHVHTVIESSECEISKSLLNYWRDGLLSRLTRVHTYHSEKWTLWSYKNMTCNIFTMSICLQRWFRKTPERIWYHGNKYWNNMFGLLRWTRSRNAQLRYGWDPRNVLIYCVNDIRISGNLQFGEDLRMSLFQIISMRTSLLFQFWMSQLLSKLTQLNYWFLLEYLN